MTPFEQLGFTMPDINGINQAVNSMPPGGRVVSGYFAGQMAGMIYSGWRARKSARLHNEQAITFQQELTELRNECGRKKQDAEIAFLHECHEEGMKLQREAALTACRDRQMEDEFRKFCESSWNTHFRPQIGAVLEEMDQPSVDSNGVPKIKLLIARSPLVANGMDKKGTYAMFCDEFKEDMVLQYNLGIDTLWMRAWERDCVSTMADTMNLHYVMQGIPTVIIFPVQRGGYISIETATWGYQLGQNHMLMDKTFRIPKAEMTEERLRTMMIAAACYVDDCYRLLLHHSQPDSLYKVQELLQKDEYVWQLSATKYRGLVEQSRESENILTVKEEDIKKLENILEQ